MTLYMEKCARCGAALTPEAQWCGQCLTPVAVVGPAEPQEPEVWTPTDAAYSRWKGGPDSFGPFGRIVLTVFLAIGAFAGYFLLQGALYLIVGIQIPPGPSYVIYVVIAVPLSGWGLARIWKKVRFR